MSILQHVEPLERALAAQGWPPMSPWWRAQIVRFYERFVRQFVFRVGRRGGKSSTLSRIAVIEALFGEHTIPPGDIGVVAIISVKLDEAKSRLRTIKKILDAIGAKYHPIDFGIEMDDRPIAFKIFAASIGGVSGFTCIFALCDEVAKWKDATTNANPATEVLASLRPTMMTQPNARIVLSSSPMGNGDAHAKSFEKGNNTFQLVAQAPSWIANPTITEEETHEAEPDLLDWSREYAAIPHDGSESSLFSPEMIELVCRKGGPAEIGYVPGQVYVAAQDPATRSDAWTISIASARRVPYGSRQRLSVVFAKEWKGRSKAPLDPDEVLLEVKGILARYGLRSVWQDQWSPDTMIALGRRHGIEVLIEPTSGPSKVIMYEGLKNLMAEGAIDIPNSGPMKTDLGNVRKWISKSGGPSIELPRVGGRHCDYAPSVALSVQKCGWATRNVGSDIPKTRPGGYQGLVGARRGDPRGGALGL